MNFKVNDEDFLIELMKVNAILKKGQAKPIDINSPYAPQPIETNSPRVDPNAQRSLETNSPYYVDPAAITNLAKKLVSQLEQSSGIGKDTTNKEPGDAFISDFKDLNSIIDFLKREGLQYNGKNIVSLAANTKADPNNPNAPSGPINPDPNVYMEYKLATGIAGTPVQNKVYIYKDGLISYLQSLQKQAVQEPNELLGAMVGRLISSANKELSLNISPKAPGQEAPGQAGAQINDGTVLDKIPNPVLLDNPSVSDTSGTAITSGDLKTPSAFNNLMKTLTLKVHDEKTPTYKMVSNEQLTDKNYCDVIQYLHQRASSKYFRSKNEQDKHYLDLVVSLGGQYNCQLGEQGQDAKQKGNSPMLGVSWKPGQPMDAETQRLLAPISNRYPLRRDMIDFVGIKNWVATYSQVMTRLKIQPDPNATTASELADNITRDYEKQSQALSVQAIIIYREIRAKAIAKHVDAKSAIHVPMAYVQTISRMLSALIDVLNSFKINFYDSMQEEWQAELDKQIDGGTGSLSSINLSQVQQWIAMMPEAMAMAEKGI